MITVKTKASVNLAARGRRRIKTGDEAALTRLEPGPITPRISRLMALAIHFDRMLRSGEAPDLYELARRGHVTQPRMSQILALNLLAPDIQEALLNLPPETAGKPLIHEKGLRPIAARTDWSDQRAAWRLLLAKNRDSDAASGVGARKNPQLE